MPDSLLPEEKARKKIDALLKKAGWKIVSREEYSPGMSAVAIEEGLLKGNLEADYLLFLEGKAIGVLEAKKESTVLSDIVANQAENYTRQLLPMYQYWEKPLPLIYLSNGKELLFRNLKEPDGKYRKLDAMHSPKKMAELAGVTSYFIGLPTLDRKGLRDCQFEAVTNLEASFRNGHQRALIVLATGAGKTFTACLAAYRFLTYTPARRVLFLVDRNNLGKQATGEFGDFKLTETGEPFNTIYTTERLRSSKVPKQANLVICTIQRLFAVITGQELQDGDDDESAFEPGSGADVELSGDLKLPPDFFDLIIVDECHRSIYGRWKKVLTYFNNARIIGLTATPGEETLNFFDNNRVANYTLEKSIADGINVDRRIFSIETSATVNGGEIRKGEKFREVTVYTGKERNTRTLEPTPYLPTDLDRAVINPEQIRLVLETFKDAVYRDMYPNREPNLAYIPKTLIFAKSDSHADNIIKIIREQVFPGQCPEFAQKITYSAGDSNALIKSFRNDKAFRIAVTVTLVATGTDVKPLEILLFMRDVNSESLYIQMRGRGCRKISDDALRNVTPNADTKDQFFLVDAIGVTKHKMTNHPPETEGGDGVNISLEKLLEQITHGYLPDDNLRLLASRLSRINDKATEAQRAEFEKLSGMGMKEMALNIFDAFDKGKLAAEPFVSSNQPNILRKGLVAPLSLHEKARKYLLILNAGFVKILQPGKDVLVSSGFSVEDAQQTISEFEAYLQQHRDEEEAIRIIAENTGEPITYDMLTDLAEKLKSVNHKFQAQTLWNAYSVLNPNLVVPLKSQIEKEALTNLIQLIRFAFKTTSELRSLASLAAQRFELWCGQNQRDVLSETQRYIVREITNYIVCSGACSRADLSASKGRQFLMEAKSAFGSMENVDKILQSLSGFMLAA